MYISEEVTAPRTRYLGKLLGLYCIAVSLSMFAYPKAIIEVMKAINRDPPLLFIAGLLGVTAGLAIVLAHNVWSGGALPILVTLFGWAALIKGTLLLVLSPETDSRVFIVGLHYEQHPNFYAAFLLLVGIYLTSASYSSGTRSLKSKKDSPPALVPRILHSDKFLRLVLCPRNSGVSPREQPRKDDDA